MESIDPRIERIKDRIEDLQEQEFEKYQSDISDTIALRVWKHYQGDIDVILAKEYLEISSASPDAICFTDGSSIALAPEPYIEPGWIRQGQQYPARLLLNRRKL